MILAIGWIQEGTEPESSQVNVGWTQATTIPQMHLIPLDWEQAGMLEKAYRIGCSLSMEKPYAVGVGSPVDVAYDIGVSYAIERAYQVGISYTLEIAYVIPVVHGLDVAYQVGVGYERRLDALLGTGVSIRAYGQLVAARSIDVSMSVDAARQVAVGYEQRLDALLGTGVSIRAYYQLDAGHSSGVSISMDVMRQVAVGYEQRLDALLGTGVSIRAYYQLDAGHSSGVSISMDVMRQVAVGYEQRLNALVGTGVSIRAYDRLYAAHSTGVSILMDVPCQAAVGYEQRLDALLGTGVSIRAYDRLYAACSTGISISMDVMRQVAVGYEQQLDALLGTGVSIRAYDRLYAAHSTGVSILMDVPCHVAVGYEQRLDALLGTGVSIRAYDWLNATRSTGVSLAMDAPCQVAVGYEQRLDKAYQVGVNYGKTLDALYGIGVSIRNYDTIGKVMMVAVSMSQPPVIVISNDCYLLYQFQRIELLDISLHTDIDSFAWSGAVRLANLGDFQTIRSGDVVTLYLQNTAYRLIATKGNYSKQGINPPDLQLDLISVSAQLMDKRVTKTWDAITARALCEELAGAVIDWQIIDWQIPAGRATCLNAPAMQYIRDIVSAVDAIVQTAPDGSLIVTYCCPVVPSHFAAHPPDHVFTSDRDILSITAHPHENGYFNAIVIGDGSTEMADSSQYQHEYEYYGDGQGVLCVWSEPWIEPDAIEIVHTGSASLLIGTPQIRLITENEHNIEFKAGQADVGKPIYRLIDVTWNQNDLGDPLWSQDSNRIYANANGGYSLGHVTYERRVIEYPLNFAVDNAGTTQFLVKELA